MRAVILLGFLACTSLAIAQATSQTLAPDGRIHTRIEGLDIPAIANAPFTAKVVVTWDQPLVGGGTVSHKYYTLVARDAQGRVHRETRDFIPASSNAEPPLRSFGITDPVAGSRINCSQDTMNCTVLDFRAPIGSPDVTIDEPASPAKGVSMQSLGEQTMNSMAVVGTRETRISNIGSRGNSRVLVSTKDLWYSPDLKIFLSVTRNDPQLGQIKLTVKDLVLGPPDPSWFSVPSGYTTVDVRRNQSPAQ